MCEVRNMPILNEDQVKAVVSEVTDLVKTNQDAVAKRKALDDAQTSRDEVKANGETTISELTAKQTAELSAAQSAVDTANAAAEQQYQAALTDSLVADRLHENEIDYLVELIKGETGIDPTPQPEPAPTPEPAPEPTPTPSDPAPPAPATPA